MQDIDLKFYDCLIFSRIINSYPLVAVFEFLGGSNYLDLCQLTLSKKKISATVLRDRLLQGAAGTAAGAFFALIFQTQHSYLRYSKREMKYFNVILFRIVCYTHKHE